MTEFLLHCLAVALLVTGIHVATREGMVFGWLGDIIYDLLGEFWSKPVIECPPCMASLWSLAYFIALRPYPPLMLLLAIPVTSAIAYLLTRQRDGEE